MRYHINVLIYLHVNKLTCKCFNMRFKFMILLVGGEKGGTGKSMISCNLAAYLANKGRDVMLMDADPQATATKWINRRNKLHPEKPKINSTQKTGDVFETVRDLSIRYEEVIIDAGGRDSEELRTALITSHKLLTPVFPAQDNIETMERMVVLVKQAKSFNRSLNAFILMNRVNTNPHVNTANDAMQFLKQQQDTFIVLDKNKINDYKVFQDANAEGLSVIEMTHGKAKAQIQLLCQSLYSEVIAKQGELVDG